MKIKKFIARSFQAGKMQIAQELGEDAVILSTRTSKGPEGDSIVEIVAAIDEGQTPAASGKRDSAVQAGKRPLKDKLSKLSSVLPSAGQPNGASSSSNSSSSSSSNSASKPLQAYRDLQNSDELVRKIEAMERQLAEINKTLKYKYSNTLHPIADEIYRKLIDSEFPEDKALEAVGSANIGSEPDPEKAKKASFKHILKSIEIGKPLKPAEDKSCTISAFVGTTGNGKTSTLVKIALVCKLVYGSKCLLVSADKHKVGGSDQLRTFASVADMDFATAYSTSEIAKVIEEKDKYDFIFFDTSGRSQNDNKNLFEVSELIKQLSPNRVFLVIGMNLSQQSVQDIIRKHSALPVTDIILTKLDEASRMGGPITALQQAEAPLTYISYGQEIPDDIYPASRDALAKLLDRAGETIRDYDQIFDRGEG